MTLTWPWVGHPDSVPTVCMPVRPMAFRAWKFHTFGHSIYAKVFGMSRPKICVMETFKVWVE